MWQPNLTLCAWLCWPGWCSAFCSGPAGCPSPSMKAARGLLPRQMGHTWMLLRGELALLQAGGGGVFAKHLSQQRPRFCCAWQGKINNRKKSLDPISRHGSLWAAWKFSFLVLSKQAMGWVHPLCFSRFFLGAPCDCCCHQWSSCGLPRGSEGK